MNNRLKIFSILFTGFLLLSSQANAQRVVAIPSDNNSVLQKPELTIEECLVKAKTNYPLYKNKQILEDTLKLNLLKTDMSFIPNLTISGQASYQSDVPSIPISMPGFNMDINKDQYQFTAELSQPIFDGGNLWATKSTLKAQQKSDEAQLDTQLYNVQNLVMSAYFNILSVNEQILQNNLLLDELQRNYQTVKNQVLNGVAQASDQDLISVDILTALKDKDDMIAKKESYYDTLAQYTGVNPKDYTLVVPNNDQELKTVESSPIFLSLGKDSFKQNYSSLQKLFQNRPEINFYGAKEEEIETSKKTNLVKGLPTLDVYVQGSYSNPGLNFFANSFDPEYMAGVRLKWNITGLYTKHQDDEIVTKQKLQILNQKQEFLFNTKISVEQNARNIESIKNQLVSDDKIIKLRTSIVKASESKMKNGVMSVTDLLTEINKLNTARQEQSFRKIQLLTQIYSLKQTLNFWNDNINNGVSK